jgi:hypothetical protein
MVITVGQWDSMGMFIPNIGSVSYGSHHLHADYNYFNHNVLHTDNVFFSLIASLLSPPEEKPQRNTRKVSLRVGVDTVLLCFSPFGLGLASPPPFQAVSSTNLLC